MPFIVSRVNFELSPAQEKELKQRLGRALIPVWAVGGMTFDRRRFA
ncbi:hypothetical protein [Actinomyces succiniciruminis]|uniref:Uncharacterized protein n=1 Tax=Actinomyces succiniciruminis TaxID=1522002 RepID=A0A1L7RS12_9ACTO|nr:hypothetical protein [Actinomyces succiniciruminis]CED92532.1 Hypothetical protein AAM4_2700 [Actinomyces succiniciruminis]